MTISQDLEKCHEACESQPLIRKRKEHCIPDTDPRIRVKNKKISCIERRRRIKGLKEYYEYQDRLVELYKQDEALLHKDNDLIQHGKENSEKETRVRRIENILARVTFILNVFLLGGNLTASVLSGSYSVISAFLDCLMDISSSCILQLSIWAINNTNMFNYPRGRERLEIVAVIICSTLMGVGNIMMIVQSVTAIVEDKVNPEANLPTIGILVGGIIGKFSCAILCYTIGSTGTKLLALDLRNDTLTSIVALAGAFLGDRIWSYADPIGAILVCSFVAVSWFSNVFNNIPLIVGKRVEQEQLSRILQIAVKHDDRIRCLDHIMVYHLGEKALVELHVVLDEELTLKLTHDLTEALQKKICALDFVERAFLHVDYQCDGRIDGYYH